MNLKSIAFVVGLGLVACSGKKEADQMTKFADEMCKCTTSECAEKLFPSVEKFTKDNEGKEVDKGAAERYNASLTRAQKCYDDLMAKGSAAPAAPAAPAEQPKTDEQK